MPNSYFLCEEDFEWGSAETTWLFIEKCHSGEFNIIELCKKLMNAGYIKLDRCWAG